VELTLIKVSDERLGDTETDTTWDGETAVYASRVRTLVDAVYDWSRFNSLPRGYDWIRGELAANRVSAAELVRAILKYGDVGTIRRMGVLFERAGVTEALLRKLRRTLAPSSSQISWIPQSPKHGAVNQRWGVVENDLELKRA
jgi:hypothetical protein